MDTVGKTTAYEKWVLILIVASIVLIYLCHTFWFSFDTLTVILFIPIFLGMRYVLNHFPLFQMAKGKLAILSLGLIGLFAWSWYWADIESQYFHYDETTGGNKPPARLSSLLSGYTVQENRQSSGDSLKTNREWIKSNNELNDIQFEIVDDQLDGIEERLNALDGRGFRNREKEREEQKAKEQKERKKHEELDAMSVSPPKD